MNLMSDSKDPSLTRSKDSLSFWLLVLPIQNDNFNLSAHEFRYAICMRNMKPVLGLSPICDGCGAVFTTTHAVDCKKGGLVTQRHNEIRDLFCDLSSIAWKNLVREPTSQEPTHFRNRLWLSGVFSIVNAQLCSTLGSLTLTLRHISICLLRTLAETEKKRKYSSACEAHHCSVTPLSFSIDGLTGRSRNPS